MRKYNDPADYNDWKKRRTTDANVEWQARIRAMDKTYTDAMAERLRVVEVISNDGEMVLYYALDNDGDKRLRAMTTRAWNANKLNKNSTRHS